MAVFFVALKGVIITHPPELKFPFHAIVFWKMEEGIDKLCLHVRNDVSSTVDNEQNSIKWSVSKITKSEEELVKTQAC